MMNKFSNIVLIGFMGTGKSTVGKVAASRLNLVFVDIDSIIEMREQKTIASIFSDYGEKYFRKLEKDIVREYSQKSGQVISTGGGVVLDPDNMKSLKSNGVIILLKARLEIILRNVSQDRTRPLLQSENPMARIMELLASREQYYKDNHYEINISDISVDEVANKVISIYNSKN